MFHHIGSHKSRRPWPPRLRHFFSACRSVLPASRKGLLLGSGETAPEGYTAPSKADFADGAMLLMVSGAQDVVVDLMRHRDSGNGSAGLLALRDQHGFEFWWAFESVTFR